MRCLLLAFAAVLAAHLSTQTPVPIGDLAGAKSADLKDTSIPSGKQRRRGSKRVINHEAAHPLVKVYSAMSVNGYHPRFYRDRKALFETDPILKEASKADSVEKYVASFDKLRPARDSELDPKVRAGINFSVTAMMAAHMKHLNKPEEFQHLARSSTARISSTASVANRDKKRRAAGKGPFPARRRKISTQERNADIFRKDMFKAGFKLGDDPIQFEKDSRVLMEGHGRAKSTWNLKDFLHLEGKDQDFIDKVRDLRLLHWNDRRWRSLDQPSNQHEDDQASPSTESHRRNAFNLGSTSTHSASSRQQASSVKSPTQKEAKQTASFHTGLQQDQVKTHSERQNGSHTTKSPSPRVVPPSLSYHSSHNQKYDRTHPHGSSNAGKEGENHSMDDATFWASMLNN